MEFYIFKLVSIFFYSIFFLYQIEDEVIGSECELQDISVTPLLNALHTHKTVAVMNLSHNFLGNDSWLLIVTSIWICFWIIKDMLTVSLHASETEAVILPSSLIFCSANSSCPLVIVSQGMERWRNFNNFSHQGKNMVI